jgi:PAS domain S-box-containing protein
MDEERELIPDSWRAALDEVFPDPVGCALWTGACLAASLAGNALVALGGGIPPFWPSAGLAFAFLMAEVGPALPLIWLCELLGCLTFGPLTAAVWLSTGCQTLAAGAAVRLYYSYKDEGAVWDRRRSMLAFLVLAVLVQGGFPATMRLFAPLLDGVFPLSSTHPLWPRQAALGWLNWLCSYAAGAILIPPLLDAWRESILSPEDDRMRETFFLAFGLVVLIWPAFSGGSTLSAFGCLPLALIAAYRLPPRTLTTLLLFTAILAATAAYASPGKGAKAEILAAAATFSLALPAGTLLLFALLRETRGQARRIELLQAELAETRAGVEETEPVPYPAQEDEDEREALRAALAEAEETAQRNEELSAALAALQDDLEELHASQMRDALMFENAVQGMFECSLDGVVLRANPALAQMLGYAGPNEAAGVGIARAHFQRPEDFDALVQALREAGAINNYELKLLRADGYPLWAMASLRLRIDADQYAYMEGALIDATSRKIAEERLRRSEERLRRILNATSEGFLFLDKELRVRDANAAIRQLTGFERQELQGRALRELLECEQGVLDQEEIEDLGAPYEALLRVKSGEPIPVLAQAGVLEDEQSGVEARFVFCTDIRALKRAEALRADVERIARHDLKTPLNAIINAPRLLLSREDVSDEDKALLRMIEEAGYRMLRLVNLSLDLYKMESGAYMLEPREVDLLPVFDKLRFELQGLLAAQRVELELRSASPEETRFLVWAEELLCYTLLANLLKNAIEASPAGARACVELYECAGSACVTIRNQGELSERMRARLFEKYATSGKEGGSGLGAYSARLIGRTLGGDVFLDEAPPGEVRITVRLPRPPEAMDAMSPS